MWCTLSFLRPFSVVVGIPMGLHILWRYGVIKPALWGVFTVLACIVPTMIVDYAFYHKWFFAPINIALYNSGTAGPNLYGVEPWHYYLSNLALNFNIGVVLFLMAPLVTVISVLINRQRMALGKLML